MDNDVDLFVFYHYDFYYMVQQLYNQHNFKKLQVWAFEILEASTVPIAEIINAKNVWAWVSMVSYIYKKNEILKRKKSWEPFRSCLLNSRAYPAQFGEH